MLLRRWDITSLVVAAVRFESSLEERWERVVEDVVRREDRVVFSASSFSNSSIISAISRSYLVKMTSYSAASYHKSSFFDSSNF